MEILAVMKFGKRLMQDTLFDSQVSRTFVTIVLALPLLGLILALAIQGLYLVLGIDPLDP